MNWLDRLLLESESQIEHFVCAKYYNISMSDDTRLIQSLGYCSVYPPSKIDKLKSKILYRYRINNMIDFIQNQSIDYIHFHFANLALEHFSIVEKFHEKCIVSFYGYDYEYYVHKYSKFENPYQKLFLTNCSFVVEGNFSKSLLKSYGANPVKIYILRMIYRIPMPNIYGNVGRAFRIFQAASFTPKKGQLEFLEALSKMKGNNCFKVILCGEIVDKQYFGEIEKLIFLEKMFQVQILGLLSFNKYLKYLSNTDVSVNFSKRTHLKDTEGGVPMFIKDSLILGKPVLSTKHCDIPDFVIHGYNGLLCNEGDTKGIANVLETVRDWSKKDYYNYSHRARRTLESSLKNNESLNSLLEIYKM